MPQNSQHKQYAAMAVRWKRCRDVAAGGDAVKEGAELYLPKLKDQPDPEYQVYKMRASFYNATWRTISGLVGMVFRKPPVQKIPASMESWVASDIDGTGRPLQLFAQEVAEDCVTVGRVGILADHSPAPEQATLAHARELNLRPTLQLYKAETIINWRIETINNKAVPTLVVLEECEMVPVDEYVSREEERWRVLDLVDAIADTTGPAGKRYRQRLFKEKEGAKGRAQSVAEFEQIGEDIYPKLRGQPLHFIPFVVISTDDVSFDVDEPPMIDLVDENLSHYRTTAIYEQCIAFCPPTLLLSGFKQENPGEKIYVGSRTALVQSSPDADGKYIEYSGSALAPLEKALDRKEAHMAILGARMLEPQRKAVEAADTAAIHRKGEESLLASMSQAISLGITTALRWMADFAGSDPNAVVYELNRNFFSAPMNPQMLAAIVSAWQQGVPGFSDQGTFDLLKEGELVRPEVTLEDEQHRIAMAMPSLDTVPEPGDGEA